MRMFLIFAFFTAFVTSCAMPDDDCLCTTPMTNNPNVIPQRDNGCLPGMGG